MILCDGWPVLFVPSHDAEYNARPDIGIVLGHHDGYYRIRVVDKNTMLGYKDYTVKEEFCAHLNNASDVLRLVSFINDRELRLISLLYEIELLAQGSSELEKSIRNKAGSRDRYHIN